MRRADHRSLAAVCLGFVVLAIAAWALLKPADRPNPTPAPVGLFSTLPILWAENADIGAALRPDVTRHWAMGAVERFGPVRPLDLLTRDDLASFRRLILAQPRILAAQENVALDDWVRGGGRLLLFADPALTQDSIFPIGDPRRPQDVVVLSPILVRWGLDLNFDAEQPLEGRQINVGSATFTVRLSGTFSVRPGADCKLSAGGALASCRIGKGRVIALADAAVLERDDPDGARARALAELLNQAFDAD